MGAAWARHAVCESALKVHARPFRVPIEMRLSFRLSVRRSVYLPVCVNTFENLVYFHEIWFWELLVKCVDLVQFWLKSTDALHGGLHVCLSACISLRNYQSAKS
jgi:hypothetical protein